MLSRTQTRAHSEELDIVDSPLVNIIDSLGTDEQTDGFKRLPSVVVGFQKHFSSVVFRRIRKCCIELPCLCTCRFTSAFIRPAVQLIFSLKHPIMCITIQMISQSKYLSFYLSIGFMQNSATCLFEQKCIRLRLNSYFS